jgi:hypothetical protein
MLLTQSTHASWPLPMPKRGGVVRIDGVYRAGGGL